MSKNLEIERKWLVTGLPYESPVEKRIVYISYLYASDNMEIRLMQQHKIIGEPTNICFSPPEFRLTFKSGNGLVREEKEISLTGESYRDLVAHCGHPYITKEWYLYPLGNGLEMEVSHVDGCWSYAEIEYPSIEASRSELIPPFLKNSREVTDLPRYQMKNYWRRTRLGEKM